MAAHPDPLSLPPVPAAGARDASSPRPDRRASSSRSRVAVPLLALSVTWSRTIGGVREAADGAMAGTGVRTAFPPAFERAFADRFGGRDLLIRLHHASLLRLFGVSGLATVLPGRDGWFYWLGEDGLSLDRNYRGIVPFAQKDVDATVARTPSPARLARGARHRRTSSRSCRRSSRSIRNSSRPGWRSRSSRRPTTASRPGCRRTSRLAFIDLRPALRAAKARDRVYYQTDSHWNFNGATVGYEAIMREVLRALPPDRLPPMRRPCSGRRTCRASITTAATSPTCWGFPAGSARTTSRRSRRCWATTTSRCAKRVDHGETPGLEIYECGRPGLPRAVVYRDSMAISLIPLLAENFSRVVFVSSRRLDPALIEREKPDIVIEEFVERSLNAPGALPMILGAAK